MRWNNLVGAEGLFWVDEGSEDLARLFAFAYRLSETKQSMAVRSRDLLFMEEGSGLLMSGMLGDRDCGDLRDWWYGDEQKSTRREQHPGHGMEERVGQARRQTRE